MTTEFAAWLVKNETEIIAKELRKKNKMVMKPKMEGAPLVNDNYLVHLKNVHPELAKQMKSRYNNANWDYGHIHLSMKYIPSQKLVNIMITVNE